MRLYEDWELYKQKCYFCGCKNKLITDIVIKGKPVGHTVRCCGCGHIDEYIFPWDATKATKAYIKGEGTTGQMRCNQPSFCPFKNCPLYGTSNTEEKEEDKTCCNGKCESCNMRYCPNRKTTLSNDKKLDSEKLDVKTCNGPEYR